MSNQRFVVVQFSDGIQVIPKIWLSGDSCKYPLHYKTDLRIRKAVEKEEKSNSDWALFKIIRTFGEYCTLQEADNKAKKAMYTSDMDTSEKETRYSRKNRAKKIYSSTESEEDLAESEILPSAPRPPAKLLKDPRQCNRNEQESLAITSEHENSSIINEYASTSVTNKRGISSYDSVKRYKLQKAANSSSYSYSSLQEADISYERNRDVYNSREENILNRSEVEEFGQYNYTYGNRRREQENDNLNDQQDATVNHLRRLTRQITTIKYDLRQALTLLDIIVKRTEGTEAKNTQFSFEGVEDLFPLETAAQLAEIEDILKHRDSQENAAIQSRILFPCS